jgi:hypothetical protein
LSEIANKESSIELYIIAKKYINHPLKKNLISRMITKLQIVPILIFNDKQNKYQDKRKKREPIKVVPFGSLENRIHLLLNLNQYFQQIPVQCR